MEKYLLLDNKIIDNFNIWPDIQEHNYLDVPTEPIMYLHNLAKETYSNLDNVVVMMGRHILQKEYFNIFNLPIIGAAKGCGHGNHVGRNGNVITESRIFSSYPIDSFYTNFGVYSDNKLE